MVQSKQIRFSNLRSTISSEVQQAPNGRVYATLECISLLRIRILKDLEGDYQRRNHLVVSLMKSLETKNKLELLTLTVAQKIIKMNTRTECHHLGGRAV
jgi:hypothetical protein